MGNIKVSDHHAIIPTEQPSALGSLSYSKRTICDSVVKWFLAALFTPFEYEQTNIRVKIGDEISDQILQSVNKGEALDIISVNGTNGMTKPQAPLMKLSFYPLWRIQ